LNIYLIDDSSFINLVCRQALSKSGHKILGESYDGEDGVKSVLAMKPDLVIMDIALPKKNGIEATIEILKSQPDLKIIAISALEEEWVEERVRAAGCIDFLKKPFTAEELVDKVTHVLGNEEELKYG